MTKTINDKINLLQSFIELEANFKKEHSIEDIKNKDDLFMEAVLNLSAANTAELALDVIIELQSKIKNLESQLNK